MGEEQDWRPFLTASERYDNIQKIQSAIINSGATSKSAFSIENEIYQTSPSRGQYDETCEALQTGYSTDAGNPASARTVAEASPSSTPPTNTAPGIRIGPHEDCYHIASGATSEVYRAGHLALKVIVETHNIEPHSPAREAKILALLADRRGITPLLSTFRDHEQRLVLSFPYKPLTLMALLARHTRASDGLSYPQVRSIYRDIFSALASIHNDGIIHRDIKPSAILLDSPTGPAYLSDFGTAWHPSLSASSEPPTRKILDIGTGPYRAPEVLFGDAGYGTAGDMWGTGVMLAECLSRPPRPLFESRGVHEDGNQLGLILSIFKTVGSPTRETWPEAERFRTPPFEMYRAFERKTWEELLEGVEVEWRHLVGMLVRYGGRATAAEALQHACLRDDPAATD